MYSMPQLGEAAKLVFPELGFAYLEVGEVKVVQLGVVPLHGRCCSGGQRSGGGLRREMARQRALDYRPRRGVGAGAAAGGGSVTPLVRKVACGVAGAALVVPTSPRMAL